MELQGQEEIAEKGEFEDGTTSSSGCRSVDYLKVPPGQ